MRRCAPLLAAGLLAGCAAAAPAVPPAEVRAVATQTRFDEVDAGRFEITLTNTGGRPFTVTSVRLDAPGFGPAPALPREEPFPPGETYDLPALFGAVRCDRPVGTATAVVDLHRDGAPAGTLRLPLTSPDGLLERLHRQECARLALARQVQVALADAVVAGPVLRAVVRVRRVATRAAVTATELRDSKLFAFTVALPARLEPAAAVLDVPAVLRPAGCYGHLLADVKQPYKFPLFLRLDAGPPQYVEVATSDAQRAQLQQVLRTACAPPP